MLELHRSVLRSDLGLASLPAENVERLAHIQFEGQQASFRVEFPDADYLMVLWNGAPVGQLVLNRAPDEIYGVDIVLLPEARGRGIGARVLQQLQDVARAGRKPFRFRVRKGNRAIGLYLRLGFLPLEESEIDLLMEWNPTLD